MQTILTLVPQWLIKRLEHSQGFVTNSMIAVILIVNSTSIKADCDNGTIILSGKPEYPPISWVKDNKLVGLGYQAMHKITNNLNKKVNFKLHTTEPLPWKRAIYMAKLGQIDILVGVRESPERSDFLTFMPTPLIELAQNVFSLNS